MSSGLYQFLYHFKHYANHPISVNYTSIRKNNKGENIMRFHSPFKVSTLSSERIRVVIKAGQPGGTGGGSTTAGLPSEFPTGTR
jgi:hypothetical protein